MKEDPFVGVYRALSPKELAEKFMNPNDPKTQARALSPKELAEMFMNPNAPKTEAEHWAVREIEKLRAEVERLRAENARLRAQIVEYFREPGTHEVERLTRQRDEARAEVERLTGKLKLVADALNETISKYHEVGDQNDRLDAENERLREALHRVSLASQNSMSSKDECGRIAREALEAKP